MTLTNDWPVFSSERVPHSYKTATLWQILESGHKPQMGFDTETEVMWMWIWFILLLARRYHLYLDLAYSSTLKMKAMCSSESSVSFYSTTRSPFPEYNNLHIHHRQSLRSQLTCVLNLTLSRFGVSYTMPPSAFFILLYPTSVVGWVTMLQAGRLRVESRWDGFFTLLNHSNRTIALGSTRPLAESSTRNLPGG
jgi:hypothetical protein